MISSSIENSEINNRGGGGGGGSFGTSGLDPAAFLNPQCIFHILSFLNPEDEIIMMNQEQQQQQQQQEDEEDDEEDEEAIIEGVPPLPGNDARFVKSFHAKLELVSSSWKDLLRGGLEGGGGEEGGIATSIPQDGISINLDTMSEGFEQYGIPWTRRNKFSISSLVCGSKKKFFVLATKLLKNYDCNTTELSHAKVSLHVPDTSPAHFQFLSNHDDDDDCNYNSFSSQALLLETLPKECPKLEHLDIVLIFSHNILFLPIDEIIQGSPSLFRCDTITSMTIEPTFPAQEETMLPYPEYMDGSTITKIIENLPSLRCLVLHSNKPKIIGEWGRHGPGGILLVSHNNIRILRIDNFCTLRVRLTLDCPQLEHLWLRLGLFRPIQRIVNDPPLGYHLNVPNTAIVHVKPLITKGSSIPDFTLTFAQWKIRAGIQ